MQFPDFTKDRLSKSERVKARDAVLRKIHKVYGLNDHDTDLPSGSTCELKTLIDSFIASDPYWIERRDNAIRFSGLDSSTEAKRIDEVATCILIEYAKAFHIRDLTSAATAQPDSQTYHNSLLRKDITRQTFARAYANHVANICQDMLQTSGLSERSALSLNGTLIGYGCDLHLKRNGIKGHIEPVVGPSASDERARETADRIAVQWKTYFNDATQNHRKAQMLSFFSGQDAINR